FSQMGHRVTAVDSDNSIITPLCNGWSPVEEPGLDELLEENLNAKRLEFTSDYAEAIQGKEFIFLSIDLPFDSDYRINLEPVFDAAIEIGQLRSGDITLCVTSQVPVGRSEQLAHIIRQEKSFRCDFVYIPEFLRVGAAVETFQNADRIVIGSENLVTALRVAELYKPLGRPIMHTDVQSAETAKHACNAYLATSISFINEMSDLCKGTGADIKEVARIMKGDKRIGPFAYLNPGPGFTTGHLERDIRTLQELGYECDCKTELLNAVMFVNRNRGKKQ
ncbi:MAG: nucleotide sugar dehydrogenase, partial [Thaumarchaeota archaeon]|nr:nucleotide sugar dehydrogenase [Nitrososphaerota archaeon]